MLLPPADIEAAVKGDMDRLTSVFTLNAPAPPPKLIASWNASNHSSLFSLDSAYTVIRSLRMMSISNAVSAAFGSCELCARKCFVAKGGYMSQYSAYGFVRLVSVEGDGIRSQRRNRSVRR